MTRPLWQDIFDDVGGGLPEDAVLAQPVAVALSLNVAQVRVSIGSLMVLKLVRQAKLKGNGDLKSAIEDCNFVLKLEPSNTKAFFRRAQVMLLQHPNHSREVALTSASQIHTKKADFQSAKSDLQKLLEIDPKNSVSFYGLARQILMSSRMPRQS